MKSPQEVVPGHRTAGLTLKGGIMPVLVLVGRRAGHIDHGQQHEDICLYDAYK